MNNDKLPELELTDAELEQVKGGGLLLPAVQKVREAGATSSDALMAPTLGAPIVKK